MALSHEWVLYPQNISQNVLTENLDHPTQSPLLWTPETISRPTSPLCSQSANPEPDSNSMFIIQLQEPSSFLSPQKLVPHSPTCACPDSPLLFLSISDLVMGTSPPFPANGPSVNHFSSKFEHPDGLSLNTVERPVGLSEKNGEHPVGPSEKNGEHPVGHSLNDHVEAGSFFDEDSIPNTTREDLFSLFQDLETTVNHPERYHHRVFYETKVMDIHDVMWDLLLDVRALLEGLCPTNPLELIGYFKDVCRRALGLFASVRYELCFSFVEKYFEPLRATFEGLRAQVEELPEVAPTPFPKATSPYVPPTPTTSIPLPRRVQHQHQRGAHFRSCLPPFLLWSPQPLPYPWDRHFHPGRDTFLMPLGAWSQYPWVSCPSWGILAPVPIGPSPLPPWWCSSTHGFSSLSLVVMGPYAPWPVGWPPTTPTPLLPFSGGRPISWPPWWPWPPWPLSIIVLPSSLLVLALGLVPGLSPLEFPPGLDTPALAPLCGLTTPLIAHFLGFCLPAIWVVLPLGGFWVVVFALGGTDGGESPPPQPPVPLAPMSLVPSPPPHGPHSTSPPPTYPCTIFKLLLSSSCGGLGVVFGVGPWLMGWWWSPVQMVDDLVYVPVGTPDY